MLYRDNAINLLGELVEKLESASFSLPPQSQLFLENNRVNRNTLNDWKEKIEKLVRELSIKWLEEDLSLESMMENWAGSLSDDSEFLNPFNRLGEIIDGWKKKLREIFFKDTSLYTMPANAAIMTDVEIIELEDKNSSDISRSEDEFSER